jgi:hypothetical protein
MSIAIGGFLLYGGTSTWEEILVDEPLVGVTLKLAKEVSPPIPQSLNNK